MKTFNDLDLNWDACPCEHRRLDGKAPPPQWHAVYTGVVLLLMILTLLTDRFLTEGVMMLALALLIAAEIVTVKDGLSGFANEGLWTVIVLFVVAGGLSATGALDWYLGKALGNPKSAPEAQLRLMIPIVIVSAFMNNTPLVVIMIPIVDRWAKKNNIAPQQVFMPLSYGSELGGTCTLIGTSTNLVVTGMLADRYGSPGINLFDLGVYGVPIALMGMMYIVVASSFILPGNTRAQSQDKSDEDILLRARVMPWSPAANRTVRRSGLRDTGGIYLVSVERSATGNMQYAVSPDFVVNVGDVLYFTGLPESFGTFCSEHGLELITEAIEGVNGRENKDLHESSEPLGATLGSINEATSHDCLREISRISDIIHGLSDDRPDELPSTESQRVLVAVDGSLYVIGVDCVDRAGLVLDISKALTALQMQMHNSEASVVDGRSYSVWRCSRTIAKPLKQSDIWETVNNVLLENGGNVVKRKGLQVVRARVLEGSSLAGEEVANIDFHRNYGAALIALQKNGRNVTKDLPQAVLNVGDLLVLHVEPGSPLLAPATKNLLVEDLEASARVSKDLQVMEREKKDGRAQREFLSAVVVAPRSGFAGKTCSQSNADSLTGVTLVSVERKEDNDEEDHMTHGDDNTTDTASLRTSFVAVPLTEPLKAGDILWYAGSASAIGDLRKVPGLISYHEQEVKKIGDKVHERHLVQAVVAAHSPLVGQTVREAHFRTRFGAVVISVQREGKRIHAYPGQIKLRSGDVLLLEAGPSFVADREDHKTGQVFTLLLDVKDSAPPRTRMLIPALLILAGVLGVYVAELCSLVTSALLGSFLMVALGIISEKEALNTIKWDVFLIVGSALGIGSALEKSGLAGIFADVVVDIGLGLGLGDAGLYGSIYLATALVSNVVTNNAAAALVFPIALGASDKFGADRDLMAFTLMFGASACFASPFGYQTNIMVQGPGNYKTTDFVKFGAPMQVLMFFWSVLVLTVIEPWYLSWIAGFALFAALAIPILCFPDRANFLDRMKKKTAKSHHT